mmetsp:Transcript_88514/g.285883  ORF Transcript_88514/g.285883 Transcript_88514/m.285883 type:complete len:264 (-) Transcript_88514:550-1341(-)
MMRDGKMVTPCVGALLRSVMGRSDRTSEPKFLVANSSSCGTRGTKCTCKSFPSSFFLRPLLGALVVKEQGLFAGFARKHRGHEQVVLQVFTDREVGHQLDAVFPDVGSRPHSTQHEQPRSPNGAGTDDDLAPGSDDDFGCAAVLGRLAKAHPCRARALEHQPRCCMVCEHSEVWTLHRSVLKEVCARRVATSCILHGDLTQAGPFLRGSIVVVVDGQPGCNTRFHKSLRNLLRLEVPILHVGNLQRTTLAVKTELPDAAHIVF